MQQWPAYTRTATVRQHYRWVVSRTAQTACPAYWCPRLLSAASIYSCPWSHACLQLLGAFAAAVNTLYSNKLVRRHTCCRISSGCGAARAVCAAVAAHSTSCHAPHTKAGCSQTTALHRPIELDLCCEVNCTGAAVGHSCSCRRAGVCLCEGDGGCWLG